MNYSWSGDPLLPQLKLNRALCCAMLCVWVGLSWDCLDGALQHEASGIAETRSPRCLSVIRGREAAHLALGRGSVSLKFSVLQHLFQRTIFTLLFTDVVDSMLYWNVAI